MKHQYLVSILVAAFLNTLPTQAFAQECVAAADEALKKMCGTYAHARLTGDVSALGNAAAPAIEVQCPRGADSSKSGDHHVVFKVIKPADRPRQPPSPEGLEPEQSAWSAAGSDACKNLVYAVYVKDPGANAQRTGTATNAQRTGTTTNQKDSSAASNRDDAPSTLYETLFVVPPSPRSETKDAAKYLGRRPASPAEAVVVLRNYQQHLNSRGGVATSIAGTATGASAVVEETLQILGQITVDRASAQAYVLIKNKLVDLLGCNGDYSSKHGFDATCRVVLTLRIEDIAMSRDVLMGALAQDIYNRIQKNHSAELQLLGRLLPGVISSALVPLIVKPGLVVDDSASRAILGAITSFASTELSGTDLPLAKQVVAVAVVAYLQCLTAENPTDDATKRLAQCNIDANVDALIGDETRIVAASHAFAHELVAMATPTPKGGDVRTRLEHAANGLFAASCMVLRNDGEHDQNFACIEPVRYLESSQDALALLQPIVVDAINRDTNALVVSMVRALKVVVDTENKGKSAKDLDDDKVLKDAKVRRLFALLGGILNYAATYVAKDSSDGDSTTAEAQHEQRTKILESLTKMMTDRTGRGGDTIVSLGGALRVVAGARLGLQSNAQTFYGPLSLPLGVHLTHLPEESGCGFHLQLDAVDLGEYLAFDSEPKVGTPHWSDALAPSLTVGLAFGASVPFVLGVTGSYSPHLAIDVARPDAKGTFNIGLTAGMQVPLIDLN